MAHTDRGELIGKIRNPLTFFTLALIVLESVLGLVVKFALPEDKRWAGFLIMVGLIVLVILIVGAITYFRPAHLYEPTKTPLYLASPGSNVVVERDEPADGPGL